MTQPGRPWLFLLAEQGLASSREASMKSLERKIKEFVEERNWAQYHSPKNLAIGISVEANELLELFMWLSETHADQLSPRQLERVREEVGDIMINLLNFCSTLGLDPVECAHAKLETIKKKYPVDKAYGLAKKYDEL